MPSSSSSSTPGAFPSSSPCSAPSTSACARSKTLWLPTPTRSAQVWSEASARSTRQSALASVSGFESWIGSAWPEIAVLLMSGFSADLPPKADLIVPFFKTISYPLGVFGFIALTYFVIVGASNAVNLTDGLDGLAIMPVVMVGSALGIFAYVVGSSVYSRYLLFPYIPGAGELLIFCAAMAGAGLAFLWFNTHPAQVFMGDVGALALGGALGTIAVITRQEIVLGIMGGIFVVEALSVMVQVGYFKWTNQGFWYLKDGAQQVSSASTQVASSAQSLSVVQPVALSLNDGTTIESVQLPMSSHARATTSYLLGPGTLHEGELRDLHRLAPGSTLPLHGNDRRALAHGAPTRPRPAGG